LTGLFIDTNFFIYMNTPSKVLDEFIEHYEKELPN